MTMVDDENMNPQWVVGRWIVVYVFIPYTPLDYYEIQIRGWLLASREARHHPPHWDAEYLNFKRRPNG